MQLTIEDISPVEKRVDFAVPWGDVAPKLERAYEQLRREVHIKGFRPGKVPRSLLEKLFRHRVENEVARDLVELSLGQAISENQIQPVAPPTVDKIELKAGEPFHFSARVEVRSQVVPKDYTGVALARRPPKVTDEDVARALDGYRKELTRFKPVEGRAVTGDDDVLVAEVHGRIGEHKIKQDTVMVDLADENAGGVPGFGPRLRGVPTGGQHLEVKYSIPDAYPMPVLAGKAVDLHVTIKEVRERQRPALDDELAKDTGEADTLEGLKQKIRQRLIEADRQKIKRELGAALVKEIIERNPFPIAPALVDRHAQLLVARAKAQLYLIGIDVEGGGGLDQDKLRQEFRSEAEAEARAAILIQAISEREGIEVTDADVQKRIAEMAAAHQENAKKLRADLEKQGRLASLKAQMVEEKTLDMLLGQAKISDVDPESRIIAPNQAGGERLVLTPDEARAELASGKPGPKPRNR